MARTTRRNRPEVLAYYGGSYYGRGWLPATLYDHQDPIFKRPTLPDGKATEIPGGKRFKATFKRLERRRLAHAVRIRDWLTATAPQKRCEWKSAWY